MYKIQQDLQLELLQVTSWCLRKLFQFKKKNCFTSLEMWLLPHFNLSRRPNTQETKVLANCIEKHSYTTSYTKISKYLWGFFKKEKAIGSFPLSVVEFAFLFCFVCLFFSCVSRSLSQTHQRDQQITYLIRLHPEDI